MGKNPLSACFFLSLFMIIGASLLQAQVPDAGPPATLIDGAAADGGGCPTVGSWDAVTGTCTLAADVAAVVAVQGPGTTLDCAGHRISNPTDQTGYFGVRIQSDEVTIRNCSIRGFSSGIQIHGPHDVSVLNNVIQAAVAWQGSGISARGGSGHEIRGNQVDSFAINLDVGEGSFHVIEQNRIQCSETDAGSGSQSGQGEPIQLQGGTWSVALVEVGDIFVDSANGIHIQRTTAAMTLEGDLHGSGTLFQTSSFNAQGNGGVSGSIELHLTLDAGSGGPITGTFFGRMGFSVHGYMVDNDLIRLKGACGFEGMRLYLYSTGFVGGPFTWTGYIDTRRD